MKQKYIVASINRNTRECNCFNKGMSEQDEMICSLHQTAKNFVLCWSEDWYSIV